MRIDILEDVIRQQKSGNAVGVVSVCSSHPHVLLAAFRRALATDSVALVESTCNQVNQKGGYSGMTPEGFPKYVRGIAGRIGLPVERILFGGDHLGPYVWRGLPIERAMQEAATLVRDYVRAGFVKIHLDASMHLAGDDQANPLPAEVAAARAARLASVAEAAAAEVGAPGMPRFVIGTEVPSPGGTTDTSDTVRVTPVPEAQATIDLTHEAFLQVGLAQAWERVLAVVVQPGVEFGDSFVHTYQPSLAQGLVRLIEPIAGMVYEVHSTDYQLRASLRRLVSDHFAILKVGPALTFAFRQMAFALAAMENELFVGRREAERSNLVQVLERAMCAQPEHWDEHYRGDEEAAALARKYSLSDRARYYWGDPSVQAALARLVRNLVDRPPPLGLLSQYAPAHYARIREGELRHDPEALLLDGIDTVLLDYELACRSASALQQK